MSGGGVTALAAALMLLLFLPPAANTLVESVTDAHVRALTQGPLIGVVSSDHHTVKPWFAGKLDISPPVADFKAKGFALTGGRVDEIAGARAAALVYRHRAHVIDLFVWADIGGRTPAAATRHGYHLMFWKAGDLDYAAVSDADATELAQFSQLVKGERE
jgi:anti-sigma factor RsiW